MRACQTQNLYSLLFYPLAVLLFATVSLGASLRHDHGDTTFQRNRQKAASTDKQSVHFNIEKANQIPWKHLYTRGGVRVASKELPGTPFVGMRFQAEMEASFARVISVLEDIRHRNAWQTELKHIEVLQRTSTPPTRLLYCLYASPWPVADREFIYKIRIQFNDKLKQLTYLAHSPSHPRPIHPSAVRGDVLHSKITIAEIRPFLTRIHAEMFADPKGSLPSWVVNFVQQQLAYLVWQRFLEFVEKDKDVDPEVYSLLNMARHHKN